MKRFISITLTLLMLFNVTLTYAVEHKIGVNTHFPYSGYSEEDFAPVYASGVELIRETINWMGIEEIKGVYNWQNYDWWMNDIEKNNKELYLVVTASKPPSFYYTDDTKSFFSTQEEIDGFCDFLKALIKRYPFIDYIELWNEPNLGFGTSASNESRMQCYADMTKAAAKTIREMSDTIEIVAGAIAVNESTSSPYIKGVDFLNYIIPQIYPYVDAVSWHTYAVKRSAESSLIQDRITNIKNSVSSVGGWKKIYISETGWVTGNVKDVSVSEDKQAYNTAKIFPVMEENDISGTLIYDFKNDGQDLTEAEHNFGLLNYDGTPKKSYNYFKNHIEKTSGYTHVGEYSKSGKETHLYVGENDAFTMAWQTPSFIEIYASNEPTYTMGVSLSEAKNLFKNIASSKLDAISKKASGMGINLSAVISEVKGYVSNAQEEEAFKGNYEIGMTALNKQLAGEVNADKKALSDLLYDIYCLGERMSAVYDISGELTEKNVASLQRRYDALNEIAETYEDDKVFISKAILDMGEEKFDKMKDNICVKKSGENFNLSGVGELTVFGKASAGSYVSVKIEKDGEIVYADTVGADTDNSYEFNCLLVDNGTYSVDISMANGDRTSFEVEREECVLTMEYIKADYIEDYAKQMLLVHGYDEVITFIEKEDKSALFNIQNGSEPQEIWVLLGGYKDGVLVGGVEEKITLSAGEIRDIPLSIDADVDSIRGYVWDGESMQPCRTVLE